jgi:hypothetical protein
MSARWLFPLLWLLAATATAQPAAPDDAGLEGAPPGKLSATELPPPPADGGGSPAPDSDSRRWSVHVDNDLFAFTDRDRDYTAGVSFGLTGERARSHWLSPGRLLERIDRVSRFAELSAGAAPQDDALEIGLALFSPQDLAAEQPLPDDRPYANLLYVASSRLALDAEHGTAFQSSLAIGFLGLPFAEQVHRGVHEIVGSTEPRGYAHQISAGGEPTFLYSVARYRLLADGDFRGRPYSIRSGVGASVGYVTEANVEIAVRTDTLWWASSPAATDYTGQPQIAGPAPAPRDRPRVQLEAGAKLHVRA